MALAVLPALFTCLCYPPTGILSAHDGLPRHPHCPHVSRRSAWSFGNDCHPCGRSAIGCAAAVRRTYRGFTWPRPFGRPGRSFRSLSFQSSLILAFTMIGFARGSRRPSFNPFGRPVRARLPPATAVSGVARWGWCPVPLPVSVPPSPARLAARPLGRGPRGPLPRSRCPGGVGGALRGLGGRPVRGPVVRSRPCGLGRPVASVGVVSRGVRPAGARAVLRRGVPRTTTPRRGWSLVRPSGARGVRRGPWRPRWGVVGRPSRPRWGVVVAWRPWPFPGGPWAPPWGRPVAVGRGALRPVSPAVAAGGGPGVKASRVPRGGVAWRPLSMNYSAPGVVSRPLGPVGASHPRTA